MDLALPDELIGSALSYLSTQDTFTCAALVCMRWKRICYTELDGLSYVTNEPPAFVWGRYKKSISHICMARLTRPVESGCLRSLRLAIGQPRLVTPLPHLEHLSVYTLPAEAARTDMPSLHSLSVGCAVGSDLSIIRRTRHVRRIRIKRVRATQVQALLQTDDVYPTVESLSLYTVMDWPAQVTLSVLSRACPYMRVLRIGACMITDQFVTRSDHVCMSQLETLSLDSTLLSTEGAAMLIRCCPNLRVLSVRNNPRVNLGALLRALAEHNTKLECLRTDTRSGMLAKLHLPRHPTLQALRLSF